MILQKIQESSDDAILEGRVVVEEFVGDIVDWMMSWL